MPLNPRSAGQIIHAQDVNDFKDLLTGVMQDQLVTLVNILQVKSRAAAPGAPTVAIAAGGSVDVGAHDYAVTFVDAAGGETLAGTHVTGTTTSGNQTENLSAIPTGPTGTTKRNIYRSKVGTTSPLFLLHTIADNSTTTYSDTATDASLPATQPPVHPNFGGSIQILDNTGAVKAQLFSDGAIRIALIESTNPGPLGGAWASGLVIGDGTGWKFPFCKEVNGVLTVMAWVDDSGGLTSNFLTAASNGTLTVAARQSGTAGSIQFNTWTGSAAVTPFSIGAAIGLSSVDNNGHFFDNGNQVPFTKATVGTAGRQIFIGTTTPTGANEGDIWIKA